MPHESCVSHPTRDWYFNIRVDYYVLTDGDHCAAAMLSILEYITSGTLEEMRSNEIPGDPWISISKQGLSNAMIDLFSERSILDAKQKLEAMGFIACRDQDFTKGCCEYLLNYEFVSQEIARKIACDAGKIARRKFNTYARKIARDTETPHAKLRALPAQNCAPLPLMSLKHLETQEEELKTAANAASTASFPATQEPSGAAAPDPAPSASRQTVFADAKTTKVASREVRIDLSITGYVEWMYNKRNGYAMGKYITGKLSSKHNQQMANRLVDAEKDFGVQEFREALYNYFENSKESLVKAEWPLDWFLKDILDYLPDTGTAGRHTSARATPDTGTGKVSSGPAANAPEPISEPLPTVEYYVQNWNQSVPEEPCDGLSDRQRGIVAETIKNPEFRAGWPKITKKCGLIAQNTDWDNKEFTWLFMTDGKLKCPNWQAVLDGKWSFAAKKSTGGKSNGAGVSGADALIARLRAERLAKEAGQARA